MKSLILKNGKTAQFLYKDRFDRPGYKLDSGTKVCCVNLNGTYLHTMSCDSGEPDCPLKDEFQPKT